jgi:hypothetical protein
MNQNGDFMLETDDALFGETNDAFFWETEEFRKGYQNAIMQFQKKYTIRNKEVHTEAQQKNPIRKLLVDTPSTNQPRSDNMTKDVTEK